MTSPRSPLGRRAVAAALVVTLVVAVLLRLRDAIATPLWFDEIYSLWVARGGMRQALHLMAADVHPPLQAITLVAWRALGGENELWLAALPLAFSVATLAAWLGFARDLFEPPASAPHGRTAGAAGAVALLSTALLAVHPFHVHLSHELRWFSMFWFFSTCTAWMAWRWHRCGRGADAALFVLSATAMLYTHYLGGMLLALIALWGFGSARRDGGRLVRWLLLLVAVALLFAPQLPIFVTQMTRQQRHWIGPAGLADLWELLRKFSLNNAYAAWPMLALAVLPLALPRRSGAALYLWLVGGVPVLAAWAATVAGGHLFSLRYMTFAVPFWCGLVAAGAMAMPRAWIRVALGGALVLVGARAAWLTPPTEEPVSLAAAAERIEAEAAPGDTIFHADTHSLLFFRQHLPDFGRHVLLMVGNDLPYYEGDAIIPEAWRVGPADLARISNDGRPWWGVMTHKAGADAAAARLLFNTLACCPPDTFGLATVWRGHAPGAAP